ARGGNESSCGNICPRFQRISCVSLEGRALPVIFARHGEGRTDRDRRNCNASVAGHDVPRGSSRPTQRACTYLRQNAQAFHPHCPRRQSFRGAVAVRFDESPHHFSRAVISLFPAKPLNASTATRRLPFEQSARIVGAKSSSKDFGLNWRLPMAEEKNAEKKT